MVISRLLIDILTEAAIGGCTWRQTGADLGDSEVRGFGRVGGQRV